MNFSEIAFKTLGFSFEKQSKESKEKREDSQKKSITQLSLEVKLQMTSYKAIVGLFLSEELWNP